VTEVAGAGGAAHGGGGHGDAALAIVPTPAPQPSSPCANEPETVLELAVGGTSREAILRRPTSVPCPMTTATGGPARAAAVIWLHGSTTVASLPDPARFAVRAVGLGKQSELQKYLTVFPRSGKTSGDKVWAWNGGAGAEDVRFLQALVQRLVAEQGVDPRRIFLAGHSSGAFLAYYMACNFTGLFAGYASYSGALRAEWGCYPKGPVSFLEVHGRDDTAVPFEGNDRFDATMDTMVHLRDQWGCAERSLHVEEPTRNVDTWTCRNKTVLRLVTLRDAGHEAPMGLVRPEMWEFFSGRSQRR
jgi:poly(3-hydroxybutyrate) depolymerase